MKTSQYRYHLENLQSWSWVWMCMQCSLSPGPPQAQELAGRSQEKKQSVLSLSGNKTPSLSHKMPFDPLWCGSGKSLLVRWFVATTMWCKKISLMGRKKKPSFLSFVNILSMNEVWEKCRAGPWLLHPENPCTSSKWTESLSILKA